VAGAVNLYKLMFTTYVIRSLKNKKSYVGYTSKESLERLQDHNTGSNKWTRQNGPFKIIHTEEFPDKKSAMQREKFLKSGQGRQWLDENTSARG
jgi:putative endonuclease